MPRVPCTFAGTKPWTRIKASAFLCADCLNKVLPQDLDQCFGAGVIHLATKEVRIFEESTVGFFLGDFYVDCTFMEDPGRNSRLLDILIFYCPVRYEAKNQDTGTEVWEDFE